MAENKPDKPSIPVIKIGPDDRTTLQDVKDQYGLKNGDKFKLVLTDKSGAARQEGVITIEEHGSSGEIGPLTQ